jgi:hypothetical protein
VAYIGIPDLRSAAVFIGAVKAGYKVSEGVQVFTLYNDFRSDPACVQLANLYR